MTKRNDRDSSLALQDEDEKGGGARLKYGSSALAEKKIRQTMSPGPPSITTKLDFNRKPEI
jgi:hypothetical protein